MRRETIVEAPNRPGLARVRPLITAVGHTDEDL